jgi:hypothetical protein
MFDFSVIVRPSATAFARLSILMNLGRKPLFHLYNDASHIATNFPTIDLAIPVVLEYPNIPAASPEKLASVFARTASREKTLCLMTLPEFAANFEKVKFFAASIGLKINAADSPIFESIANSPEALNAFCQIPLVLLNANDAPADLNAHELKLALLREIFSPNVQLGVWMNIHAGSDCKEVARQTLDLAVAGVGIIYLKCEWNDELGYYDSADVLPEVYDQLYKNSAHSQVTLLANGIKSPADLGVAMMLGASAGVVDRAVVVAMNHAFPRLERDGHSLPDFDEEAGLQRVQNLFKSWHKQIREVLGAFGVRDIRRTVGRARPLDRSARARNHAKHRDRRGAAREKQRENKTKIQEDGELAKQHTWKYSELENSCRPWWPRITICLAIARRVLLRCSRRAATVGGRQMSLPALGKSRAVWWHRIACPKPARISAPAALTACNLRR